MTSAANVIKHLKANGHPDVLEGMARFGIRPARPLGVRIPFLRACAKGLGADHKLAMDLWASGYHEARILASMVDRPQWVTRRQMNGWAADMDTWDLADQCCGNLFDKTPFAVEKAIGWSHHRHEFVKRCGFVIMACRAIHITDAPDREFSAWFEIVNREADDDRIYVRKAVNWCLRQIGKRNADLRRGAIECARRMLKPHASSTARWIASDALRELKGRESRGNC